MEQIDFKKMDKESGCSSMPKTQEIVQDEIVSMKIWTAYRDYLKIIRDGVLRARTM